MSKTATAQTTNLVEMTIPMPGTELSESAKDFLARAQALVIDNDNDYEAAAIALITLNRRESELEAQRKELKVPVDEAAARIQRLFKPPLEVFARAKAIVKMKLSTYAQLQEKLRRDEQLRQEELAQKERDRLAAQAARAAAAGKVEKAAALEQRSNMVVAPIINRDPPKVAGVQLREMWRYEIVDESLIPREYLMVEESKIRRVVAALKKDCAIPGIRVWKDVGVAAGSA